MAQCYFEQESGTLVVPDGATAKVESGGTLQIVAGATVTGLAAVTEQTALADLTEGAGAIGGTNDGDLPSLASPDDTKLTAAVREVAAKLNALLAKLRTAGVIADE